MIEVALSVLLAAPVAAGIAYLLLWEDEWSFGLGEVPEGWRPW